MGAQDQGFFEFVRQHMINVTQSLYHCDGTDENPISIDDTIEEVIAKMADGVYRNGHPELLDNEVQTLFWALKEEVLNLGWRVDGPDDEITYQWPPAHQMMKEIHLFGKKATEEQVSEMLDVQPWDIKDRTATEEGIRLVWIGVVLRKLAIVARQESQRKQEYKDE